MQTDEIWSVSRVRYGLSGGREDSTPTTQINEVKTARGTRDYLPEQMAIRRKVMDAVVSVFERHSAVQIDTPVFQLKEILTGKYGAESKLIYDLQDQGGQLCSLRYDLTVPFARFMASNTNISKIKRYHIGKVYRRDKPAFARGRYREFYQCDFDIAGKYDAMIPDAEVVATMQEILQSLDICDFIVKLNHRALLQAMVAEAGCPLLFKTICSSIDKLDKQPWAQVKAQLITKGVSEEQANLFGTYTQLKGTPHQLLHRLQSQHIFKSPSVLPVYDDLRKLFRYLAAMKRIEKVSFDLSLARGLDYYTGVIFEIVVNDSTMGSVAGGGRYDNLIGMFSQHEIPSVGGSVGIERLFTILEQRMKDSVKVNPCEVMVATIGKIDPSEKFAILGELWRGDIKAETMYLEKAKPDKQIEHAFQHKIPIVLWLGKDQIKSGKVKVKVLYKYEEVTVERKELIKELNHIIQVYREDLKLGKVVFTDPKKNKKK